MLGNIKDDEIQRRLDKLRRDTNNNNDGDDNEVDIDVDDLLRKYDNLRRQPIPKPRLQKYEDELLHRYHR